MIQMCVCRLLAVEPSNDFNLHNQQVSFPSQNVQGFFTSTNSIAQNGGVVKICRVCVCTCVCLFFSYIYMYTYMCAPASIYMYACVYMYGDKLHYKYLA